MNTHPLRVARTGAPEPASTHQREVALELLKAAGDAGIYRDDFLQGTGPCAGHRMTQIGARLDELEDEGFIFESFKANKTDRFVTYRLVSEPVTRPKFRKTRKGGAQAHVEDAPIEQQSVADTRQVPAPRQDQSARGWPCTQCGQRNNPECDARYHFDVLSGPIAQAVEMLPVALAAESIAASITFVSQPGLFGEPPATYRDPESQQ